MKDTEYDKMIDDDAVDGYKDRHFFVCNCLKCWGTPLIIITMMMQTLTMVKLSSAWGCFSPHAF
jgi:hypothetical protein